MEDQMKQLVIEAVKTPHGNTVCVCPKRGGIITSIKFKGKEILYLDEATLHDQSINVRGGIPILFPNAGPLEGSLYPHLKQHGFARDSSRWNIEKDNHGFKEVLVSDDETLARFPHPFHLSINAHFENDDSLTIFQEVENTSSSDMLPLSIGFHPYFTVPNDQKRNIKFNFEGGDFVENQVETWVNGYSISIDNPIAPMEIIIPGLGALTIEASKEFKKIWVWSLPEKDFICIEPVMRNNGGLVDNPEMVNPQEKLVARMNIRLG